MTSSDRLTRNLRRLEKQIHGLATKPGLAHSSIDGGALELRDVHGNTTGYVGQQYDGTFTVAPVGGSYPVAPSQPLVTPVQGGLTIYWDGNYDDGSVTRMDFKRVTFHAVPLADGVDAIDPLNAAQIIGEITTALGGEVNAVLPPIEYLVAAVAWTDSGKFSPESEPSFGTPLSLVDDAVFQDALDQVAAATEATANAPAIYRQPIQPGVAEGKKAVWYDTANGNLASFFDGTTWTELPIGEGALAVGAVIAETIAGDALDGKTITGALIQTLADLDLGIKLVDNVLLAYDAVGDPVFLLDGDTGAISMDGAVLSGGSITGPTIQTSPTVDRGLKIVGNVLTAYDSVGNPALIANGNDGSLTLTGPAISGAEVIGSVFKTAATNERLEIGTGDASEVKFFSGASLETSPSRIVADAGLDIHGVDLVSYLVMETGTVTGRPRRSRIAMSSDASGLHAQASDRLLLDVSKNSGQYVLLDEDGKIKTLAVAGQTLTGGEVGPSTTGTRVTLLATTGTLAYIGAAGADPASVGVAANAVDLNATNVRANGKKILVKDDADWTYVPAAGHVSGLGFQNSWVNFGGAEVPARSILMGGRVDLQFSIKSGANASVAFKLPVAHRPSHTLTIRGADADIVIVGVSAGASAGNVIPYLTDGTNAQVRLAIPFAI